MRVRNTYRMLILAAIATAGIGAACNRHTTERAAQTAQTPAPATLAPAPTPASASTRMTSAPGADRFGDDPHPERVDVTQLTKESLAQGITDYVRAEAKRQDGVFRIEDPSKRHHSI